MANAVVAQLKKLKHEAIAPRAEWKAQNRAMLLSQIKNTVPAKPGVGLAEKLVAVFSIFMPEAVLMNIARPVALFLIVALVGPSLYYGTVLASQEALPGENMYAAKRYTEKIQSTVVGFIGDQQAQTRLHVEFAVRRADETSKIITTNNPDRIAQVASTVADLKNEINSISSSLEESNGGGSMPATVARDIKQSTEQIKDVLQDAKNNLLIATAGTGSKELADEVKVTKDLVQDVAVKAVEVMVTKHLEGDQSVSKDDVKTALATSVQNTLDSVAVSKQNVDGAKTILDTVKTEVKDISHEIKGVELVSSTKAVTASLASAVTQTQVAVQQTDNVSESATLKASEVTVLVGNDNLTGAVDKIKELNQVSKDAEKISDTTIEQTQIVLPLVDVIKGSATIESSTSTVIVPIVSSTKFSSSTAAVVTSTATTTAPAATASSTKAATTTKN